MDLVFKCPKCAQELEVDSAGAGQEIECPACHETITIPAPDPAAAPPPVAAPAGTGIPGGGVVNAIASSAAAKVEMHLKVPVRDKPSEVLVTNSARPLEIAAKESDRKMRVKTIRHVDCVEVGRDHFDEVVSNFLVKVGEANVVSITSISFSNLDIVSQKLLTDYGVMIVFRG
jgi:hypothetical protein